MNYYITRKNSSTQTLNSVKECTVSITLNATFFCDKSFRLKYYSRKLCNRKLLPNLKALKSKYEHFIFRCLFVLNKCLTIFEHMKTNDQLLKTGERCVYSLSKKFCINAGRGNHNEYRNAHQDHDFLLQIQGKEKHF